MMQLQNYNATTAEEPGDTSRSGNSWMKPSLLMSKKKESKSGDDPVPGFTTIDDAIRIAKNLLIHLSILGEYKHPLDVRRGRKEVVKMVEHGENSLTLKAGSKTYFFDIRETKDDKPYLMVTESRFKGEGEERERNTIIIFQENAQEFAEAVSQMTKKLE
jgi:hypothetical protein